MLSIQMILSFYRGERLKAFESKQFGGKNGASPFRQNWFQLASLELSLVRCISPQIQLYI